MGLTFGRNEMSRRKVIVNDMMQTDYVYYLSEPIGKNFHPEFLPELNPKQMLKWESSAANT